MIKPLIFADDPECTNDPELFFPISTGSRALLETERAKSICRRCPYRARCLAWAIQHREKGIWGGTTENDRKNILQSIINRRHHRMRMTRYELYRITEEMIEKGMSLADAARTIGYSPKHVSWSRQKVQREIEQGVWTP